MHCLEYLTSKFVSIPSVFQLCFSRLAWFHSMAFTTLFSMVWGSFFSQAAVADLVTIKETTPAIFLVEETGYLDRVMRDKVPVSIYLANGKRLHGEVRSHSAEELLLVSQQVELVIHKTAVSTILLKQPRYYLGYAAY